ncbi:dihydrolipoamide acetyltransferase family protein [Prosthecobacter sp.]|uniref:dihydrolipoamide acetyltransferase family protein n=1 Tax=Prosthecobacter sp. TaxID=1965333 RepID=UPI001DB0A18B|nr:dihydrolipoamide acetyltransferase family protein [Prosthecobacter sp.]MCB1275942.1 2-oxo acid dehydrogenase subunit E2 [Prosthecobacter sp.]
MPKFIEMPKLSDTMTEGTLAKWTVKEGDKVSVGKAIADIETDKATMEYASPFEGVLHKFIAMPGGKVPLGAPLAVILEEDEAAPANLDELIAKAQAAAAPAPAAEKKPADAATKTASAGPRLPQAPQHRSRAAAGNSNIRVKASPLAKKIAAERGVDLAALVGSGPGGRIVRFDVENAPAGGAGGRVAATPAIRPTYGPEDERVVTSSMRNIIAERLLASKTQIPHFYLQMEVDAGPLMEFRAHLNASAEKNGGNKYTVNDFILKSVIRAAQAQPAINAAWDGDAIVKFKSVGLSVAIAIDDGLVTPVIKQAETKTLLEISQSVKDLAGKAKNKKLSPDDFAGGTITVSNLGAYGIDQFAAIINPPQAAIVAIGSIRSAPVVNDKGQIVVGQRMWVGLSGDHRVVDGAVAATFLAEMRKLLENPALMLV